MIPIFLFLGTFFRSRFNLGLEILALRQQLSVLRRKHPRPRLQIQDRVFWILLRRLWPAWRKVLVIVKPETVVGWHRAGFRLFWRIRSRPKSIGRPIIDAEVRAIIRRMVKENPTWGAPRIHGELLKLGLQISERTVSRYTHRLVPSDQKRKLWATFLRNHRDVITPWTSLPYRLSPSKSCIVSSSSNTAGDASSILMSPNTPPALGLCNNLGRPSGNLVLTVMRFSIEMRNSEQMSSN